MSQFSMQKMLSHSTKIFEGELLCFVIFQVTKTFVDMRVEGGSLTIFCQNIFVSQYRFFS